MKMAIEIIIMLAITAIAIDFMVRVLRFAKTGRGRGEDFKFAWWREV